MELMRKILNSPLTRRKSQSQTSAASTPVTNGGSTINTAELSKTMSAVGERHRYFGVPLEEITLREGTDVPRLVVNVCQCICHQGLDQEGIFRISGNARTIERLKTNIEIGNGDFDIGDDDIMAVAGLLKLFLRELPDSLIPEKLVRRFIDVQANYADDTETYHSEMKSLLSLLPKPNYLTLKYLMSLLVIIAKHESQNKMNPISLGIVFGPNIFRSVSSQQVFRDQGLTNFVVLKFISNYDDLFLAPGEVTTSSTSFTLPSVQKAVKMPPPRPPTPKHDDMASPRRAVRRRSIGDQRDELKLVLASTRGSDDESIDTPRRSSSPFHLDSDRSEACSVMSPYIPTNPERVGKVIRSVVAGHLFDDLSSDEQSNNDHIEKAPVPLPRRRKQDKLSTNSVSTDNSNERELPTNSVNGDLFSQISKQTSGTLKPFKRPAGPKNRRPPSLHTGGEPAEVATRSVDDRNVKSPAKTLGFPTNHDSDDVEEIEAVEIPLPAARPSCLIPPLDLSSLHKHRNGSEAIPVAIDHVTVPTADVDDCQNHNDVDWLGKFADEPHNHKPINNNHDDQKTHNDTEHRDQFDDDRESLNEKDKRRPLPAKRSHSQREALPSPSALHVSPYLTSHLDTDMPPSPTTHQTYVENKQLDDHRRQIKILTKTIQSCKKKIKAFEEQFEKQHGYRPTAASKASDADIKKCIAELSSARKELLKLKEQSEKQQQKDVESPDTQSLSPMHHLAGGQGPAELSPGGREPADGSRALPNRREDVHQRLENMCEQLCSQLREQRRDTGRPEDLRLMDADQIRDEKVAVQKALLHFEGLYGRPITKSEKEAMRPLYSRYRQIKQLLATKPSSPRGKGPDLETVPEGAAMNFATSLQDLRTATSVREPVRIPNATAFCDFSNEDYDDTKLFVTSLLPGGTETLSRTTGHRNLPQRTGNTERRFTKTDQDVDVSPERTKTNVLHELSLTQLQSEKQDAVSEKRRLARKLRQFEESFLRQYGRKVSKEDRGPMNEDYRLYKQVKAKIKLLETLATKQQQS